MDYGMVFEPSHPAFYLKIETDSNLSIFKIDNSFYICMLNSIKLLTF